MARSLVRIRTVFTGLPGTPGYNVIYCDDDGSNAAGYQDAMFNFWTDVAGQMASGLTVTMENPMTILDDSTGNVTGVVTGAGQTFTNGGSTPSLPPFTNGLVRLHTGVYVANRELRGRIFIPYPRQDTETAGKPNSTFMSTVQEAAEDLLELDRFNGAMVVWSRTHLVSNYVSSVSTWDQYASLRSRRD